MEKTYNDRKRTDRLFTGLGAAAAGLFILYSIASVIIMLFFEGGYPDTAAKCFQMLEENRLSALLSLDILTAVVIPFYLVLFYGIYTTVKRSHPNASAIALFLVLGGIVVFMSTVNILSIVNIGDKYLAAESEELKTLYLAACEGMLADDMWINTGFVYRGLMIESGAIIFSAVMIRSRLFSAVTGWVGLLTHSFDFLSIVFGLFYAPVKDLFTYIAGPLYVLWFIMLLIDMIRLRSTSRIKG